MLCFSCFLVQINFLSIQLWNSNDLSYSWNNYEVLLWSFKYLIGWLNLGLFNDNCSTTLVIQHQKKRYYPGICLQENHKTSVRKTGWSEIWTRDLPHTKYDSKLLCHIRWQMLKRSDVLFVVACKHVNNCFLLNGTMISCKVWI